MWSVGDDRVGYQSPLLAELAGKQQIVAVTNLSVLGVDPKSGEILWSQEYGDEDQDGSANPVLLGDDRILLMGRTEMNAYQITRDGDAFEIEPAWTSKSLKGSFATPVLHDGHLYGFDKEILRCVTLDGKSAWTVRGLGDGAVLGTPDRLITLTGDGELIVSRATPDAFEELSRVELFDDGGEYWARPVLAGGILYCRSSLGGLVARDHRGE